MTSETMERLRGKFWKWKEAFEIENKRLKMNIRNTKVVVNGEEGE